MSAAPSEPEKYSIDEMMERLKKSTSESPEEGELVTRSDGTEAIRVRKRKRRSSQPKKEQKIRSRRSHIIQISAAIITAILAALAIGAAVIYVNSPVFRDNLVSKIRSTTGANADLTIFRMNPKTANAGSLNLEWPEGNVLETLSMRGIISEIFPSSLFGKSMNGEETTLTQVNAVLRIPTADQPLRFEPAPQGIPPIRFKRYRTTNFNADFLSADGSAAIRLTKSEASLATNAVNGRSQLSLNQGELFLKGWPKMRVDRAFMEFRGKEIDVIGLRILDDSENRGVFEFSGTITPYSPDKLSTLSVEIKLFQLSGLLGPDLGQFISGRIDSLSTTKSNYFTFYPSENPTAKLAVTFHSSVSSAIEFSKFPFLFNLSQTLGDDWYQRPVFDGESASATFLRQSSDVNLTEMNFENKGRMAIRGNISLSSTSVLSGELEIGIADAMVSTAKASRLTTLFGPPSEGFRWMKVKLGGTAAKPTDNFKDQFLAPDSNSAEESGTSDHKGSTFEELTSPRK